MSKLTLDDIFNDDELGLLNEKPKTSGIKSEDDRLLDSFEEINLFYDKNKREPGSSSMSEFNLFARLKAFREDEAKKILLKPSDRHNLLGHVELHEPSFEDILNDDDLGLLKSEGDLSIYKFVHTPKPEERAETDFVAQRKPIPDKEFAKYDEMFRQIHKDLKEGKRKLVDFTHFEDNLKVGKFYIADGVMLYLESSDAEKVLKEQKSGDRERIDGRTVTIFENGTKSNLLFRSLGKAIQKNGKLITDTLAETEKDLYKNAGLVSEDSTQNGWIYVLKSRSKNPQISSVKNLYKIGLSKIPVEDRIKNASKEATYLYSDVEVIAKYNCYDLNLRVFENLIHRFFAEVCLNVDINLENGQRLTPREWFVAPLPLIDEAINMLIDGGIVNYRYDADNHKIILR